MPCRVTLVLISSLGFVVVYMLRVNLSVALVSMVNGTGIEDLNATQQDCPAPELNPNATNSSASKPTAAQFNWDEETQGLILGSFFWGYMLTQIPGGIAAEVYGAKWVFGLGVLCTSLLTLLTPLTAVWSLEALVILRVLEGIGEGVTFPAIYAMIGRWAPAGERSVMIIATVSGSYIGTVIGQPISGWLCASDFMGGWPAVFYVCGAVGCIWFCLWSVLAYSTPQLHPRISDKEKLYILNNVPAAAHESRSSWAQLRQLPVRQILSSPAVWALIVMHCSFNWTFYMFLTSLPSFLSHVLAMPIGQDSLVSALPYLSLAVVATATAAGVDIARGRAWLSTSALRKCACLAGSVCSAGGLLVLGHIGCNWELAAACLTLFVGLSGIAVAGFSANHLDLSPQFCGSLLGLTNTLATIPGIVAPSVVGAFTNHASSRANWLKVFYLSAAVNLLGALCFLCCGSGQLQPWGGAQTANEDLGCREDYNDDDGEGYCHNDSDVTPIVN